jgi:uncharacterized protein YgbK (DUF1537 family)
MLKLVIIADDLTGTLDAGAPFADTGLRVRVATHPGALAAAMTGAEVLAVSTRSREIAPDLAAAAVRGVLAALPAGVRLFKKVDSRLKGNVAAELAVMPLGPTLAVPGLPEFGRVVRDGCVSGFGVAQPIPVDLGRAATVPDTLTVQDMARAVDDHRGALIVGARGAAVALAARMGNGRVREKTLALPMVIAVGSTDPITLEQVAALRAACPDLGWTSAPDGIAHPTPGADIALVQAVPGRGASGPQIAAALGASLAPLMADARTLIVTGGATAEAVLDALGIDVLDLDGDVLPGLPLSRAQGLMVVTKSGGFGDARTFVALAERAEAR